MVRSYGIKSETRSCLEQYFCPFGQYRFCMVLTWRFNNLFILNKKILIGRIEEALKLAPKALSILSHVPAIHFNLGNIFGKNGDFPTAEGHFKKAIELKIENIPAVYYANLGQ